MLAQLLLSLTWKSVLVLHDNDNGIDPDIGRSLEASGISYVDYDIYSFSTDEHLLTILEKVLKSTINVLFLCDVTATVTGLHQLSGVCGTRSNSSVDWCHVSRVLVVGKSDDLTVLLDSNITLENVALLELPTGQGYSSNVRLWTLVFHPDGRAFTDVAIYNQTVTNPTDVFPNVKFGYNGRQLTVVMRENHFGTGHVTMNERRVFGFTFRLLKLLAEAMNFSYRIIPPREDDWGKNINGSWTGLLGMLQRREADLAPEMLTIHSDRTAAADYLLPPVAESKQMILYEKDADVDEDHLLIFLRSFQPYVFFMFGVSMTSCIIALASVRIFHNKNEFSAPVTSKDKIQSTTSTAFEILGATMKQGSTISSSYDSDRILVAAWWMFTTIISAVYCGTIVALFAVQLEKPPFANLAELAVRKDYTIGYDSSSITETLFKNSKQSDVMAIKQRVQDSSARDPDVFSSNASKHLQKVKEGKYAYIAGLVLIPVSNADCKLKVMDTKFGRTFESFHLPKRSPFKQDFQKSMYLLSDSGILQRTYQEWFPPSANDGCPGEDHNPRAVSLIKIQSIFFAVGVGLFFSSMILVAEIVWYKMKQKFRQN